MKTKLNALVFILSLILTMTTPAENTYAHGDHDHDEHKEEMLISYLSGASSQIQEVQNNSLLSPKEKMLMATEILIDSLPQAHEHACSGNCKDKKAVGFKGSLAKFGKFIIQLPKAARKSIATGLKGALDFAVEPNMFGKVEHIITSLKRKGHTRVAELWHRHGMISTFFVATIIGVTYFPYTIVTEFAESLVLGPAHVWCTFFQMQYLMGVTYSLKYIDTFALIINYLVKKRLKSPYHFLDNSLNLTFIDLELKIALEVSQETQAKQVQKIADISNDFISLKTKPFLKKIAIHTKDINQKKIIRKFREFFDSQIIMARLWHDNLMFMGESLRELVQIRYNEAIHEAEEHVLQTVSEKDIDTVFRKSLAMVNKRLRIIRKHYSDWEASGKDDLQKREKIEKDFIEFIRVMTNHEPDVFDLDMSFQNFIELRDIDKKLSCQSGF